MTTLLVGMPGLPRPRSSEFREVDGENVGKLPFIRSAHGRRRVVSAAPSGGSAFARRYSSRRMRIGCDSAARAAGMRAASAATTSTIPTAIDSVTGSEGVTP